MYGTSQKTVLSYMSFMTENPKRALLVIDVQNEYFTGKLPVTSPAGSLANVLSAMDAAREHGMPVVVIQHASPQTDAPVFRKGSKEWELHTDVVALPATRWSRRTAGNRASSTCW
jgi:nicotinamidase-related amidase